MTVNEIKQALGGWELRLKEDTPKEVLDALTFYGHIAIVPGRIDPAQYGDNLLSTARYVGVYLGRDQHDDYTLKGSGMAFWLGDSDEKGDVFESAVVLTNETFANSISALLPAGGAIASGVINSVPGTYTGKHQWEPPRKSLDYVTDIFNAEYRVNGDGTLDAGTVAQLYGTDPKGLLIRKDSGADLQRKAFAGRMGMGTDVEDTTTRVVLLAEGEGSSISTGQADAPPTPYKDIHGNPIRITRLVSESDTSSGNATARAQLQLNRFLNPRRSVALSTNEIDVKGTFVVGDYLEVYDPENGFVDPSREAYWKGERVNPVLLRCVEMSWPVLADWTVAFRDIDGNWKDLSPCYVPESGETTIVVGELARGFASVGGGEPVGVRPNLPDSTSAGDDSIPAAPVFGNISSGSYQPADGAWTKSAILLTWSEPLNTDGSTITDGGHYEIRYRVGTYIGYTVRWGQLEAYRWGELGGNTWGASITDPVTTSGEWTVVYVGWDQAQVMVQELTPGIEYEFQIRAVDAAVPAHEGPWSASTFAVASGDLFAPSTPAPPMVASSLISIQVVHTLGKASGGLFNLEPDISYLSVHVGSVNSFQPDDTNQVGKLLATSGMIQAQIAAVGTFPLDDTNSVWVKVIAVDRAGNKSGASAGVQATVQLIDNAHISDLSVSKVTAGMVNAAWILAGSIKTATSGARMEMDGLGLRAYNILGQNTVNVGSDGSATITGTLKTSVDGAGVSVVPGAVPRIILKPAASDDHEAHLFGQYFGGTQNATELSIRRVNLDTTTTIDGGKVLLMESGAILSHQPDVGTEQFIWIDPDMITVRSKELILSATPDVGDELYIGVNATGGGNFHFQGKWPNYFSANSRQGIFTGYVLVSSGVTGASLSYGATMVGAMVPIVSVMNNPATQYTWMLSDWSPTVFNVKYGAGSSGISAVGFWNFRTDVA